MKLFKLLLVAMFTLYWAGTKEPMLIGQKAFIICGPYEGLHVVINYTWADGNVDVTRFGGFEHYYITDYRCLDKEDI